MLTNLITILAIALSLNALPVSANQLSALTSEANFNGAILTSSSTQINNAPYPLTNSKPYNEANDPAFRRCGTNSEGPRHGYFAVPLLVLGLAGALLYFSKNDDSKS